MQSSLFTQGSSPITAVLAGWDPKCNSEGEPRIRLDFEVPLTDELIAGAASGLQRVIATVADHAIGMPQGPMSTEFDQTIEIYSTPDHTTPVITLPHLKVGKLLVYRPTPKEGPSDSLFLKFSVNVVAPMPFGGQLAVWALEHNHKTLFFRSFDVQGKLPLEDPTPAEPKPRGRPRKSGKDAAAGE